MKKILLLLSSLFLFACANIDTGVDESKEAQISRLLKEADKKKEKTVEVEKKLVTDNGEEVIEEEATVQNKKSHKEMNALQADVQQYQEKKAQLKAYQEKLQKLEELNNAGIK